MSAPSTIIHQTETARRYADLKYRLLLVEMAAGWAFLAFLHASGGSRLLANRMSRLGFSDGVALLGYLAVFGLAYYLVLLPLHFYGSFILEHRFGLSRMTLGAWVIRELKHVAVGAILGALLLEGFYALLRYAPSTWPIWATLGWVGFSVGIARVFPTLLLPIFYKTTPLQNDELVQRLLTMCDRVGLPALGVFRFDLGAETRKANAALAGLGKTRRVLVSDTLVAEFTPEEIEGVLAHELAHHHYRHITKMLALAAIGSWIAFWLTQAAGARWAPALGLRSLDDPAGVPVLMLWFSVLGLLVSPAQNAVSRAFEWESDYFAVAATGAHAAFAGALQRLAALNLADPAPPRWIVWLFYDHPPITERIRAASKK